MNEGKLQALENYFFANRTCFYLFYVCTLKKTPADSKIPLNLDVSEYESHT